MIATLNPAHRLAANDRIAAHPLVGALRYNTGMVAPGSPRETLAGLLSVSRGKPLFIDLKCRQLRVRHWTAPNYGEIVLSHKVSLDLSAPAYLVLRGGASCRITSVDGDKVYLEEAPEQALGQGQAVNILGKDVVVHGFLTTSDLEWLEACREQGVMDICLSFAEGDEDLVRVREVLPTGRFVLKIESPKGLAWIAKGKPAGTRLMCARDDLGVTLPHPSLILGAMRQIITADSSAILASHLMRGLEHGGASVQDFTDAAFGVSLGYREFMLSDGVCVRYFEAAMSQWERFLAQYGGTL